MLLDAAVRTLDLCLSFPVLMLLPGPHFHIHVELVCLLSKFGGWLSPNYAHHKDCSRP